MCVQFLQRNKGHICGQPYTLTVETMDIMNYLVFEHTYRIYSLFTTQIIIKRWRPQRRLCEFRVEEIYSI